jgi:hypothetical protein
MRIGFSSSSRPLARISSLRRKKLVKKKNKSAKSKLNLKKLRILPSKRSPNLRGCKRRPWKRG